MTSIREEWIGSRLKALLARRSPPAPIRLRPEMQAEEVASLLRAVLRHAPRERFQDWWPKFEDKLLAESATYSWPHPGDIEKAGRACYEKPASRPGEDWKPDSYAINARRMNAGEAVGDAWLYGREAVELLTRGLVDQATIDRYRSGLWFLLLSVYGEEKARRMERDFRQRHDSAADLAGVPRHRVAIPDMRRMTPAEDFA